MASDRLRRERMAAGLCRCGAVPKPGLRSCERCIRDATDRMKRKRANTNHCRNNAAHGAPAPGQYQCEACLDARRVHNAQERIQRALVGLCTWIGCERDAEPGFDRCREHVERERRRQVLRSPSARREGSG